MVNKSWAENIWILTLDHDLSRYEVKIKWLRIVIKLLWLVTHKCNRYTILDTSWMIVIVLLKLDE